MFKKGHVRYLFIGLYNRETVLVNVWTLNFEL